MALWAAEMLKKYTGFELERDIYPVRKSPNLTGDGIRMAWDVGAAPTDMVIHMAHGVPELEFMPLFQSPELIVNMSGERFVNEEVMANTTFFGNEIAQQKNKSVFMILDENTKKRVQETGPREGPFGKIDIDRDLQKAIDRGNRNIVIADTLDELASKTGINPKGLKKTIVEYNSACAAGRDELFYKNPKSLNPVKQPKFYAGRFLPHALGTLGGIRINYKTEVLNKDLEIIPGLYAAGLDANSIYGDSYMWMMSGNTFGFAINSGRMAGENAVEYISEINKTFS